MTRLPHRPTEHMRPISARRGLDGFEGLSHSSRRRGHAMACRQVARRWLLTSRSSHPNDHSSIVPHRVPESPDLGGPCNFPVHSPNAAAVRVQSGHDRRSSVSQAPIRTLPARPKLTPWIIPALLSIFAFYKCASPPLSDALRPCFGLVCFDRALVFRHLSAHLHRAAEPRGCAYAQIASISVSPVRVLPSLLSHSWVIARHRYGSPSVPRPILDL